MLTRRKTSSSPSSSASSSSSSSSAEAAPAPAPAPAKAPSMQAAVVSNAAITDTKDKKKAKSKKSKASLEPVSIAIASDLEECTRLADVVEYLDFDNIRSLSCANKSILNDVCTLPAMELVWRSLLYSAVIDEWKEYEINIEKERRDLIEKHFGCRKVALAVKSNTCSSCGSFTANLDLMTCSRACSDCWKCKDSGERGQSMSPFALCTLSYAKQHYLLSDSDIAKNLLVWQVNDPDRCHGLLNEKIKVVNEKKVKDVAIEKFNSMDGLAQEKTARSLKSENKWIDKCDAAKADGKSAPPMPDQVRKEREKRKPNHTNFVCVNQRYGKLYHHSERYGYYKGMYGTNHTVNISPQSLPTIIVTDATDEELGSIYEGYDITRFVPPPIQKVQSEDKEVSSSGSSKLPETPVDDTIAELVDKNELSMSNTSNKEDVEEVDELKVLSNTTDSQLSRPKLVVYTNLVDAICCSSRNDFSVIVIDKNCNLPQMITTAAPHDLKEHVIRTGLSVGNIEQSNTITLFRSIMISGTDNCNIISTSAIFWMSQMESRQHCYFKNLKMLTDNENGPSDFSHCIVGNKCRIEMENCTLQCNTSGFVVAISGTTILYDCEFISPNGIGTLYLVAPEFDEHGRENLIIERNRFVSGAPFFGGIMDNNSSDKKISSAFFDKLREQNEEVLNDEFDDDEMYGDCG